MNKNLKFSVILPFHNQRDEVESTLTALYESDDLSFELFIIDDASTDGTAQAIHSLVDYYQHAHTFFFEHTAPAGRGNCLNEALQQANTSIIWAPHSIDVIYVSALNDAINKLSQAGAPFITQLFTPPETSDGWQQLIGESTLPHDGQFLWNLKEMASVQQFFNPFLHRFHALDLAGRLNASKELSVAEPFFEPFSLAVPAPPSLGERQELIMSLLRRPELPDEMRITLIDLLRDLPKLASNKTEAEEEHDLLEEALALKLDGQLSAALELVEQVLGKEPGNPDAKQLKIKILERKRHFVEASELKHELQSEGKPKTIHPEIAPEHIKTSLIIPTVLYGKPALEHCLISVAEYCNPATTELIIIDNASLDDTHDYLNEIQEKNFFNCTVITHKQNKGFAASVNQGFEAARGRYACVIHNDVEFNSPALQQLEQLMDAHPAFALMGPLADSSLNPDQLAGTKQLYEGEVAETDYVDSFCMMIRMEAGVAMDEEYNLAFFDDIDFSFQMRKEGHKVGIAPGVEVTHHYGTTTFALDLDTESELYWKNISRFNDKWGVEIYPEEKLQSKSPLEQLLMLDEVVNPLYPEEAIKKHFEALFTDELKTEIRKTDYDAETLCKLVHLMMVMEKREVMRNLEDRLEGADLPAGLIYEIVRFYYNRNIYSRCLHYLDQLTSRQESLQSELYRLAILIDEKKMGKAIPKLTELLDKAPSNPLLYKLAGDVHAFENNADEAASFYKLAHQINPFDFSQHYNELRL